MTFWRGLLAPSASPALITPRSRFGSSTWQDPRWTDLGPSEFWPVDDKRASLDPDLQDRLDRIEASLVAQGFSPQIWYAWRNLADQDRLVRAGKSKTKFSYHNVVDETGAPAARAADYIDSVGKWGVRIVRNKEGRSVEVKDPRTFPRAKAFFLALGQAAQDEGLVWGGNYRKRGLWAKEGLGWDPGHVQLDSGEDLPAWESYTRAIMSQIA